MPVGIKIVQTFRKLAGWTGLEPAAFRVTGGRYNQLNYHPASGVLRTINLREPSRRCKTFELFPSLNLLTNSASKPSLTQSFWKIEATARSMSRLELPILFENQHFVAVDKPSGTLTTPSRWGAKDPRPCLGLELQARQGAQIYPVHRLDLEVSGVVLFAKTAPAHQAANRWFESRFVVKEYEALTHALEGATPVATWQMWESKLLRGKRRAYESSGGRESLTQVQFQGVALEKPQRILRWKIRPHTGRPHQIRYELAKHHFPIWGDELYGGLPLSHKPDVIALRAVRLSFAELAARTEWELPEEIVAPSLELEDFFEVSR